MKIVTKGRKAYNPKTSEIQANEDFTKTTIIKSFIDALNFIDKYVAPIVFVIISIVISLGVVYFKKDGFEFMKPIIEVVFSYLSITIGFSITSLIFIIDNIKKAKVDLYETVRQILSLFVIFIIHGLLLIILFVIQLSVGSLVYLNDLCLYRIVNVVGITFYISMIFINVYIFYIITKTVFYFAKILIEEQKN